ncbi:unnamed protein product [Caenorhabditis sp. 36 PRJEB53466]|nr:unnamed protein product [Caenorhabditis sp. 36 PRJEB53466]
MSEGTSAQIDSLDEKKDDSELLNIRIPTQTKKSQKRKHIKTDFGSVDLDESVLEAQRAEKLRLDRQKVKPQSDHLQQMESLFMTGNGALPQLDISHQDFDFDDGFGDKVFEDDTKKVKMEFEQKPTAYSQPSTSRGPVAFVDLTEDSDDDCMITDVRSTLPAIAPGRRMRWAQAEKDKIDADQMEQQHSLEAKRLKKVRSMKDLESTEKLGGRLLVNSGHPAGEADVFVIARLTHILQPHQLGGIRFMYDNTIESVEEYKKSEGFGCILAHSMGLGKTIQVITFSEIFLRATNARKVLIIVPINTIQNWYAEYEKWIPRISECGDRIREFEVFLLGDTVKTFDQRVNLIEKWDQKGGVLLIGYDMFRQLIKLTNPKKEKKGRPKLNLSGVSSGFVKNSVEDAKDELDFETGFTNGGRVRQEAYDLLRCALLDPGPELVVCDEGHKIKNITAEISLTLGAIKTKRRIVLTGYPLQNNLMEYFCMIDFVRPKFLGTRKGFIEKFEKPIKNGQCVDSTERDVKIALQRTHVLVELVKGFVQRRTHHLLKQILPESKEYVLLLRKSPIQRMLYRNFVLYARNELAQNDAATFNPLMAFSACSKIWNHPDILFRVVEKIKNSEFLAEEKKKAAEVKVMMQQQQQQGMMMMQNGMIGQNMMYGYGGHQSNGMAYQNGSWTNALQSLPASPFNSVPSNPSTPSTPVKKPRKGRPSRKTKSDEDDEEMEKETRMRYDWTYQLFENYQEGVLENGYKLTIAIEILDESTKIGEKILIFSQNLGALDLLEEVLRNRRILGKDGRTIVWEKNRNYLRLDGQTSGTEREKLINRFNSESGLHLFLISTRAGSLDACWNPCHDAQAVCRVYRYGQQKKTFVYRLIMDNSMERSIFNRQISKHGLQQRVVDDAQVDANISQKELETLLMYDEALDVNHEKWDTKEWEFGDAVLETITNKMSQMLAAKPFLHESLIMESEKTLSEEEKREAQILFEREKQRENNDPLGGLNMLYNNAMLPMNMQPSTSYNQLNQWNSSPMHVQMHQNYQTPPPPPYPPHIPPPPNLQPSQYAMRPTPMPQSLRLTHYSGPNYQPGGHTMTSYNNGFGMNNNNNNSMVPHQMLAPHDPTAFTGCSHLKPAKFSASGAVQLLTTDRALCFPLAGRRLTLHAVPAHTEIQLVVTRNGALLKTADGTIMEAQNSIFHDHAESLRAAFTTMEFNKEPEVIDLD